MRLTPDVQQRLTLLLASDTLSLMGQLIVLRRLSRHQLYDQQCMEDHFHQLLTVNAKQLPFSADLGLAIEKARSQYRKHCESTMLMYGEYLFSLCQVASEALCFSDVINALSIGVADQERAHELYCHKNGLGLLLLNSIEDTADRFRCRGGRSWQGAGAASIAFARYYNESLVQLTRAGLMKPQTLIAGHTQGNVTFLARRAGAKQ